MASPWDLTLANILQPNQQWMSSSAVAGSTTTDPFSLGSLTGTSTDLIGLSSSAFNPFSFSPSAASDPFSLSLFNSISTPQPTPTFTLSPTLAPSSVQDPLESMIGLSTKAPTASLFSPQGALIEVSNIEQGLAPATGLNGSSNSSVTNLLGGGTANTRASSGFDPSLLSVLIEKIKKKENQSSSTARQPSSPTETKQTNSIPTSNTTTVVSTPNPVVETPPTEAQQPFNNNDSGGSEGGDSP